MRSRVLFVLVTLFVVALAFVARVVFVEPEAHPTVATAPSIAPRENVSPTLDPLDASGEWSRERRSVEGEPRGATSMSTTIADSGSASATQPGGGPASLVLRVDVFDVSGSSLYEAMSEGQRRVHGQLLPVLLGAPPEVGLPLPDDAPRLVARGSHVANLKGQSWWEFSSRREEPGWCALSWFGTVVAVRAYEANTTRLEFLVDARDLPYAHGDVRVLVTTEDLNRPWAGAVLTLSGGPGVGLRSESDTRGGARFVDVPAGTYELEIWADGYSRSWWNLEVHDGRETNLGTVIMRLPAVLEGTVRADRVEVEGTTLAAVRLDHGRNLDHPPFGSADGTTERMSDPVFARVVDGVFRFDGLDRAEYVVGWEYSFTPELVRRARRESLLDFAQVDLREHSSVYIEFVPSAEGLLEARRSILGTRIAGESLHR